MPHPLRNVTNPDAVNLTSDQVAAISAAQLATSTRSNGKVLLSPEAASVTGWTACRVDAAMCINFYGQRWSVLAVPGVHVGERVLCLPAQQGAALFVRAESELPPGTLASRLEPVHSLAHTCPQCGTRASWGTAPTCGGPAHQCSCPCPHVAHTPQTPPDATLEGHMHSRTSGTAGGALVVCSLSIALAPAQGRRQSQKRGRKDSRRSQVALHISIGGKS